MDSPLKELPELAKLASIHVRAVDDIVRIIGFEAAGARLICGCHTIFTPAVAPIAVASRTPD